MSNEELEGAFVAYRNQLASQAALADRDLDEIEDHMRDLVTDLRERGVPTATAVAEAARRLGDPTIIAREHTRIRTAFGTRLSRGRAWSAALLLLAMLALNAYAIYPHVDVVSWFTLRLGIYVGLVIGLVRGAACTRPMLLGSAAYNVCSAFAMLATQVAPLHALPWLLATLAAFVFLVPWRQHELSAAGMSLALAMWSYVAASVTLGVQLAEGFSAWHVMPPALGAYVAAMLATIGAVMRARWSSAASVVTTVLLAASVFSVDLAEITSSDVGSWRLSMLVMAVIGVFAASATAVLSWRSARSLLGTLRSVAS